MGDRSGTHAETLAKPKAQRLKKPSWKDSRLVIGVLLIAAATLGGTVLVNQVDERVEVYQATTGLVPGQQLTPSDVTTTKVRLDDTQKAYLLADKPLPKGRVVREVRKGELIPGDAVGNAAKVRLKVISVQVEPSFAATLVRGSTADVWVSARRDEAGGTEYEKPSRVVPRAYVYRVPRTESGGLRMASSQNVAVQILVPDDRVEEVIDAVNSESKITLVATSDSPMREDVP